MSLRRRGNTTLRVGLTYYFFKFCDRKISRCKIPACNDRTCSLLLPAQIGESVPLTQRRGEAECRGHIMVCKVAMNECFEGAGEPPSSMGWEVNGN